MQHTAAIAASSVGILAFGSIVRRRYNGLTFTGRPGTDQLSNHEDRFAGPVQCSVGLSGCRPDAIRQRHAVAHHVRKQRHHVVHILLDDVVPIAKAKADGALEAKLT
jgi:hypothetical protein